VEVTRFGKGDEQQARQDARRKAHWTWVSNQFANAQERRDARHKREIRAFYANKRKKAKEKSK